MEPLLEETLSESGCTIRLLGCIRKIQLKLRVTKITQDAEVKLELLLQGFPVLGHRLLEFAHLIQEVREFGQRESMSLRQV